VQKYYSDIDSLREKIIKLERDIEIRNELIQKFSDPWITGIVEADIKYWKSYYGYPNTPEMNRWMRVDKLINEAKKVIE
jgi:hypothetical protein